MTRVSCEMSVESLEIYTNGCAEEAAFSKKDTPRKRSKVSRACDACRRKKIRCNAEFLASLLRVTKMCTNCTKTGENCLFSRVPLKRGPTKGYIRDLAGSMLELKNGHFFHDGLDLQNPRPRLKLVDAAGISLSSQSDQVPELYQISLPSPLSNSVSKPHIHHRPKFSSASHIAKPIILPPLVGTQPLTQPVKMTLPIPRYSASVSPHTGDANYPSVHGIALGANGDFADGRIQGPLWKVPYEMPTSNTPRSGMSSPGISNSASNNTSFDSRRSSIDSVSSILTAGSVSHLPPLPSHGSVSSQPAAYHSDLEDMDSRYSEKNSPRNSIGSFLLLNNKVANQLSLSDQVPKSSQHLPDKLLPPMQAPLFSLQQHSPFIPHPQQPPQSISQQLSGFPNNGVSFPPSFCSSVDRKAIDSLDLNLRQYYRNFQPEFPLLPFDGSSIPSMIIELQSPPLPQSSIIPFFAVALNNLVNYQRISFDSVRSLLSHFTGIYPLNNYSSPYTNEALFLIFGGLLLINYTLLLRGDTCSTAMALANGAFTDLKVTQTFRNASRETLQHLNRDHIQLYLPRLRLCLQIIDICQALSWGTPSQLLFYSEISLVDLAPLLTRDNFDSEFLLNVELANHFRQLEKTRSEELFSKDSRVKRSVGSLSWKLDGEYESNLCLRITSLLKDKYDLYDFAVEVLKYFASHSEIDFGDEYTRDHIHDYQLKTSRLIKKLSQSVLNMANYFATSGLGMVQSHLEKESKTINPFFNLCFGQSLRLIKVSKDLLDSLIKHSGDNEIIGRSMKIINELSIATNLLIGVINQTRTQIDALHLSLQGRVSPTNSNATSGCFASHGLGTTALQVVCRKLEIFHLKFGGSVNLQLSSDESKSSKLWRDEFMGAAEFSIFSEDQEGWL